jgi:hypothetical protein
MKKSKYLKLNSSDFLKGLLVALITALLTGLYQVIQTGGDLTWIALKPVILATVGAGISYLLKNLFTNSEGETGRDESGKPIGAPAKIIFLAILFSGIELSGSAQHPTPRQQVPDKVKNDPWSGFFAPVDKNLFAVRSLRESPSPSVWLFRPTVGISAMQLTPSSVEGKVFDVSSFQSVGAGMSYQHFVDYNGNPYNNYGFNFLFLFDAIPRETTTLNVSVAGTMSALEFINFGVGYNLGLKKPFILTGLIYNFN